MVSANSPPENTLVSSYWNFVFPLAAAFGCGFLLAWYLKGRPGSKISQLTLQEVKDVLMDNREYKFLIVVRNDLKMTKGKVCAQCSHAAVKAYMQMLETDRKMLRNWLNNGQPKVVVKIDTEAEMLDIANQAKDVGILTSLIRDSGRTQVTPGSRTVLGLGPALAQDIDPITRHLKLL